MLDIPTLAKQPGPASTIRQNWYRWFMNTPNGPSVVAAERGDFARRCWEAWSPTWRFAEEFFRESAKSFQHPDWVETTIHCYCYWYGNAKGDPALQQYEEQLWRSPKIPVPTIALVGDSNPLYPVSALADQGSLFTGHYERRVLQGIGQNQPKEQPAAFVRAVEDVMGISAPR